MPLEIYSSHSPPTTLTTWKCSAPSSASMNQARKNPSHWDPPLRFPGLPFWKQSQNSLLASDWCLTSVLATLTHGTTVSTKRKSTYPTQVAMKVTGQMTRLTSTEIQMSCGLSEQASHVSVWRMYAGWIPGPLLKMYRFLPITMALDKLDWVFTSSTSMGYISAWMLIWKWVLLYRYRTLIEDIWDRLGKFITRSGGVERISVRLRNNIENKSSHLFLYLTRLEAKQLQSTLFCCQKTEEINPNGTSKEFLYC